MSEDVKIYVSKKGINKTGTEISNALDALVIHRTNGNIDKAKKLGEFLSTITPTGQDGLVVELKNHLAAKYFTADILYQIKVLLVFACETILQIEIPVSTITATAITSMYSEIEKNSPGFYKNISSGAAFTFYYLAVQKGGNLSENIGEAFAMLCSVKNKEGFVKAGETVWNIAVDLIEKEIEKADFKYI